MPFFKRGSNTQPTKDFGDALGIEGAFEHPSLSELIALNSAQAEMEQAQKLPEIEAEHVAVMEALQKEM